MTDTTKEEGSDAEDNQIPTKAQPFKAKSCKGYLYYSSVLNSNSRNPRCVGISRTIAQVPGNVVGNNETENSKDGQDLADFTYSCVGYSVYVDGMGSQPVKKKNAKVPACVGLEVLVERRVPRNEQVPASAQIHDKEDKRELPLPQRHQPAQSVGDEFLSRFTRNANLVASAVAKNLHRVGNYIKKNIDDMLYPYRRPPK